MTQKKKKGTRKWVVPFVIFSIFIFTGLAIWLQFQTTVELSATLITCFYAFCTTELLALASIEKTKIKNHYDIDEDGIPDDEDPYIDPIYIQEVEEALNKIKNQINNNNKSEG